MRISDWSSDVCSSDLVNPFAETPEGLVYAADAKINFDDNAAFRQKEGSTHLIQCPLFLLPLITFQFSLSMTQNLTILARLMLTRQIGRASCRERVCQYV